MKYLFDAIEDRMNEFPALMLKGRKLYVGFESANVNAVKPYTELNARLRDRLDTFSSDVEVWDLAFRFHSDDVRTIDAHDWVDEMTAAFKDADIESGVFQTAGCRMVNATVPNLTNGLFDASIGFELTIQREQGLPIPEDAGTGIVPATATFTQTKDSTIAQNDPTAYYGDSAILSFGNVSPGSVISQHAVLHFDLIALPVGAYVTEASLSLFCAVSNGGPTAATVNRLTTAAWVETEVTWQRASTALDWTDGGDFTATDAVSFTTPVAPSFSTPFAITGLEVLARDAILSRSSQLHLLIKNASEVTPGTRYTWVGSREAIVAAERPLLTVSYA